MQHRRRVMVSLAATSLIASALVAWGSPASAATQTFTQPEPVVATWESTGRVSASTGSLDVPVVPDADGETSTLTVAGPALARTVDVAVQVNLIHPSVDDLDLVLVAPDGRAMTLIGDVGGVNGLDGWVEIGAFSFGGMTGPLAPYSDTSIDPEVERGLPTDFDTTPGDADAFPGAAPASFVPLFGTDVSGVWTLHAYDDTTGNVGSVTGWSIRLTYGITASPSPSTLVVSGTPQVVTDVDLMLHDVDSGHLSDTEVVLESPDGRYAHVLSDAGGSAVADLDMALDDEAGADIPESETPAAGGSYRPRNYDGGDASEPLGGVETIAMDARLSVFDGGPATGTWKLWLFQECCGASSAIASWSLRITTADPPPTPASVVSDTTAPVLSGVRLRPGLLPTGEGARLKVTSSERASLAGVVQRRREGKWQAVGTKRWSLAAGANTRTFYGKTSERRLRSGAYRVRLVATDPAGNSSATTSIRFRVDRG